MVIDIFITLRQTKTRQTALFTYQITEKLQMTFSSAVAIFRQKMKLFHVNFCTLSFQFRFQLFSFCFGDSFFDHFRSSVNKLFCFFQLKFLVTSRTTLITLTLEAPADTSSTFQSSFFSAACSSVSCCCNYNTCCLQTPNSSSHAFTNSFSSNTDNSLIASIISAVVNLAILISSIFKIFTCRSYAAFHLFSD